MPEIAPLSIIFFKSVSFEIDEETTFSYISHCKKTGILSHSFSGGKNNPLLKYDILGPPKSACAYTYGYIVGKFHEKTDSYRTLLATAIKILYKHYLLGRYHRRSIKANFFELWI